MNHVNNHRLFYLQSFLSTAPTVLLVSLIPYILANFQLTKELIVQVGFIYLIIRFSIILGSRYAYLLLKKYPFYKISALLELTHSCLLIGIFFSVEKKLSILFTVLISLRFIGLGLLNNTRFTWLKHATNLPKKESIYILSTVFTQSSYIISGICLIFFKESSYSLIKATILLDIISSIFGSYLFFKLKKIATSRYSIPTLKGKFKYSKPIKFLLATEIFFAFVLGGTNTLIYQLGSKNLSEFGGYGLVLIIYAIFYMISGTIISKAGESKKLSRYSLLLLFTSLLLITYSKFLPVFIFAVSLFFFSSSIFALTLEKKWFSWSTKEKSSQLFSTKILIASGISALCESFYSLVPNYENLIRLTATLICIYLFYFFLNRYSNSNHQNS